MRGEAPAEEQLVPLPDRWTFTATTPWDEGDVTWLEACLRMARHFDPPHDVVECQRNIPVGEPRGDWRLLREQAGLSLRQLARRIGVDQASVSRWETGQRWPDSVDYATWLREAAERHGEEVRLAAFHAHQKRDGWIGPDTHIGQDLEARTDHWHTMWKAGGLFDRWQETGTLPTWTPRDAGIASPPT